MSNRSVPSQSAGRQGAVFVFLFMAVMALGCFVAAFMLGSEPRVDLVRTGERSFQVTGENTLAGITLASKTVQGVKEVVTDDDYRGRRGDSQVEQQRQRARQQLNLKGDNRQQVNWDREEDYLLVHQFMIGSAPHLALRDPAPLWRKAAAWGLLVFGLLVLAGGVKAFFPPK